MCSVCLVYTLYTEYHVNIISSHIILCNAKGQALVIFHNMAHCARPKFGAPTLIFSIMDHLNLVPPQLSALWREPPVPPKIWCCLDIQSSYHSLKQIFHSPYEEHNHSFSHNLIVIILFIQVALVDQNVERGKASKDAFDKQFEAQRTIFISCDVSSEEKLKGKGVCCVSPAVYPVRVRGRKYVIDIKSVQVRMWWRKPISNQDL